MPAWPDALDRYVPIRLLGEGGFGSVHLAKDQQLGREVAVKLLRGAANDEESRARFQREARTTSSLQHPSIVGVYDFALLEDGRGVIVYELVDGPSLSAYLQGEVAQAGEVARWGVQLCEALALAHEAGILHRDIKPANILLRDRSTPVLCDFGLARSEEGTYRTTEGKILGTLRYLAPELLLGTGWSAAADQFALGATLFEAASGEPVRQEGYIDDLIAGRPLAPPPPLQGSPQANALDRVLRRALAGQPEARYPDLRALGEALAQVTNGGAAVAPGPVPSGPSERTFDPSASGRDVARAGRDPSDPSSSRPGEDTRRTAAPVSPEADPPERSRVPVVLALALVAGAAGFLGGPRPAAAPGGAGPAAATDGARGPSAEEVEQIWAQGKRLLAESQAAAQWWIERSGRDVSFEAIEEVLDPRAEDRAHQLGRKAIAWSRRALLAGLGEPEALAHPVAGEVIGGLLVAVVDQPLGALSSCREASQGRLTEDNQNFLGNVTRMTRLEQVRTRLADGFSALLGLWMPVVPQAPGWLVRYLVQTHNRVGGMIPEALVRRIEAQVLQASSGVELHDPLRAAFQIASKVRGIDRSHCRVALDTLEVAQEGLTRWLHEFEPDDFRYFTSWTLSMRAEVLKGCQGTPLQGLEPGTFPDFFEKVLAHYPDVSSQQQRVIRRAVAKLDEVHQQLTLGPEWATTLSSFDRFATLYPTVSGHLEVPAPGTDEDIRAMVSRFGSAYERKDR